MVGIYKILNSLNGKSYVGSSNAISYRWIHHRYGLRHGCHFNVHLQRAWDKYGEVNFVFSILEKCELSELASREQYWMDTLKPEYNILKFAKSTQGIQVSEATRKKMSEAHKNRAKYHTKPPHSEDTKQKISDSLIKKGHNKNNTWFLGHKHTEESKEKIRASAILRHSKDKL